jgi:hypothetical protein
MNSNTHVRVKAERHIHTECGLRFLPLLHTSYIRDYWLAPLSEMCSQGAVSSKEPSDNSGLCPVQRQKSGLVVGLGHDISFGAKHFHIKST